jgi:hypothetical protein
MPVAWKAAAMVLLSLAVGMIFAGKTNVASDNYVYVALALGGLVTSPFDRWQWRAQVRSVSRASESSVGHRMSAPGGPR